LSLVPNRGLVVGSGLDTGTPFSRAGNKTPLPEMFFKRKHLILKGLRLQPGTDREYVAQVEMFDCVGETLRRLRKERHLTLEELGAQAGLGRGQLSRIENGRQHATLKTLAKILSSQGVSRREFFRRYDLVESEKIQVERTSAPEPGTYPIGTSAAALPGEIKEALGRVESFMQSTFQHAQPVAQGAVEVGEFVVLFRVVPRGTAGGDLTAGATPSPPPSPGSPKRGRRKKR
jgi:transcriptional regulator with XRE-family HTH domain